VGASSGAIFGAKIYPSIKNAFYGKPEETKKAK